MRFFLIHKSNISRMIKCIATLVVSFSAFIVFKIRSDITFPTRLKWVLLQVLSNILRPRLYAIYKETHPPPIALAGEYLEGCKTLTEYYCCVSKFKTFILQFWVNPNFIVRTPYTARYRWYVFLVPMPTFSQSYANNQLITHHH